MVRIKLPGKGDKGDRQQLPQQQPEQERKPGFRARGRMRRRLRYLRKARELAYRDLGGLTYTLYRFGGRREELMSAKLERLATIDRELRALEKALKDERPYTVLREAGVVACPRCAEIHSSEYRFCPFCGLERSPAAKLPLTTAAPANQQQPEQQTPSSTPAEPEAPSGSQAEPEAPSGSQTQELERTRQLSDLPLQPGPGGPPSPEETQILPPQEGKQGS